MSPVGVLGGGEHMLGEPVPCSRVARSEFGRAIGVSAAAPVSRYAAALLSVENIGRSGGALR